MDELVNRMEMMTKNVQSLTLQHYVLKRDFNVIKNKLIFFNGINILYCTLIKPVLKCGPHHVDSF